MVSDQTPAVGETIGQRLKRLRLERGLSQREVATPGVSYAYISRIEAGTRQPSVKALRKLAAKLEVTAGYLETGSDLASDEALELRLSDLELAVRLGDWEQAEGPLEQIAAEAAGAGDRNAARRARVALAALAHERGEYGRAASLLEAAVADEPFLPADHFDIYTKLGRAYAADGRTRQAIELFERCLVEVQSLDSAFAARYATLLSYALSDIGANARAERVVRQALELAGDSSDPYMRVRLYWSMARLAHNEGRESVALQNVRKAIALLEATDDSFHLGRAHLLAARITVARNDATVTDEHLDRAAKLLGNAPAIEDKAELKILRSRVALAKGDAAEAEKFARRALDLNGISDVDQGYATAAYGDALALGGSYDEAEDAYSRAVDVLEMAGQHREAAQTCRNWGQMLLKLRREGDAARVLDRASELMLRIVPAEVHAG